MQYSNIVEFQVSGRYALFTDPLLKSGGEKYSYQIPTYQALKGILESVYWKPTFMWVIDSVRVMNPIKTQSQGVRPILYNGGNTLAIYTYLTDVKYKVRAHFVFNEHRKDLEADRNEHKHFQIAKRMIERGGRRDIFLGTRECQGYVEPGSYDEEDGFYDGYGELDFGVMVHGFNYPDETGLEELQVRLWRPKMKDGQIQFIKPEECTLIKKLKNMSAKEFTEDNFSGLNEIGLLDGLMDCEGR